MNPYALPPSEPTPEVDADTLQSAKRTARSLASGGAVVGSIASRLKSQGLDPTNAEQIATYAVIERSRLERFTGFCIAGFGTCLVVVGYVLSFYFLRRIPIYVAMAGMFFVLLGLAKAFHRSKLRRPQPTEKRRLR